MGYKWRDYINCYSLKILGNKIKKFKFREIKFKFKIPQILETKKYNLPK